MSNSDKTTKGKFYIMFNEMFLFYGNDVYKLGKAKDISNRLNGYTTSYIEPPEIKFLSKVCKNYNLLEKNIFNKLAKQRIKPNREFFKLTNIKETKQIIELEVERINNLSIDEIELELKQPNVNKPKPNKPTIDKHNDDILNFYLLLKSDIHLNELKELEPNNKALNKVLLLRQFEEQNKIKNLDINFDESNPQMNITDDNLNLIKKVFRITKDKPTNIKELNKFYIGMLRNIIGNLELIKTDSKTNTNNKNSKDLKYIWNEELNKQLFEVNLNMSQNYFNFDILKRLKMDFGKNNR